MTPDAIYVWHTPHDNDACIKGVCHAANGYLHIFCTVRRCQMVETFTAFVRGWDTAAVYREADRHLEVHPDLALTIFRGRGF